VNLNWPFLISAVLLGGTVASTGLVFIAHRHCVWPTVPDMEHAAELGAAIGGALTFTLQL
jgi:hypothetical protein